MAHFLKPAGNFTSGYDIDNKLAKGSVWRLRIPQGETRKIALWGGADLQISSNNPNVLSEIYEDWGTDQKNRIFRLTGQTEGTTMIETRDQAGGLWVSLQVQVAALDNKLGFIGPTVTGKDATDRVRLINFQIKDGTLAVEHIVALRRFVESLRTKVVTDVFINGYAHDDFNVGLARANSVAHAFSKLAPDLSETMTVQSVNDTPWRGTNSKSDAYWRGVDVFAYVKTRLPVPAYHTVKDEVPPPPGPRRFADWEVYAMAGTTFQIAPLAVITIDALHFRRKSMRSYGGWACAVRFGAGQAAGILESAGTLKRIKRLGGPMALFRLLGRLPKKKDIPLLDGILEKLTGALAGVSFSPPDHEDAPAVTPFALSDLNGATALGGSAEVKLVQRVSYGVAGISVTQKMPTYDYKFIDTRTPPQYKMIGFSTKYLVADVPTGGASADANTLNKRAKFDIDPEVSLQFTGGPLILL